MTTKPEQQAPRMMTIATGGGMPAQTAQSMPTRTGGPQPPVQVPGSAPGTSTRPLPTSSPIGVMNWASKLASGDENAMTRKVGGNELVQDRLTRLIDSDSQYITQAEDRARSEASGRGMMMSTMAAGAGRRAAIDAALPIASQDASTFARTASENMAAVNADRLADQQMFGQLTGQEVGIRANLDESERARGFTSNENALGRQFQSHERQDTQSWQQRMQEAQNRFQTGERLGSQSFQTGERVGTQAFQAQQQAMQNAWQGAQNDTQRQHELVQLEHQQAHDASMRILDQKFQGSQLDKQMLQQRFLQFEQSMSNQSSMLSQTIASIYNNPNLNAQQQNQAVANARAVYQSIFTSYAQSLAGGLPPIFYQPYPMSARPATGGGPMPPTGGPLPPSTVGGGATGTTGGLRVGPMLNFGYGGSGSRL